MSSAQVGPLQLPLTASGTTNDALEDPVVDLLLAFVGHMLTIDLDPKLAELPATTSTSCPSARRYGYDVREPRGQHVALKPPGLWIWWDGRSTIYKHTTLRHYRRRELNLLYLFPELPLTTPLNVRRGLMSAVDASLTRAFNEQFGYRHATFSHNSSAVNAHICTTIATLDTLDIEFLGGRGLQRIGIDDRNTTSLGAKASGRDYPGYAAVFAVHERTDWIATPAHNVTHVATIQSDGLDVAERYVPAPNPDEDISDG